MPRLIGAYNWDTAQVNRTADEDQNSGVLGDTGTDLKVGVGQLKQASYALGDLAARPFRSEDDETFSERLAKADENEVGSDAWMAKKNAEYSEARQASERDYEATKASFGDSALGQIGGTLYGLATNPRAAFGRVMQSAPAMVAGGGVGGAIAKGGTALGMMARAGAIARAASVGSAAAEGIQSGANNAYDLINYNMQNGRGRYEGVGVNQVVTALGVGATSLLGAKVGGGIEASIFNKEARQALRTGNKGTVRAIAGEGGEESVQSIWEDVPQNLSMGKAWDEGLYGDMAEGGFTGGALGGGVHLSHRVLGTAGPEAVLKNANKPASEAPQAEQTEAPQAEQTEAPQAEQPAERVYALGYDPRVGTRNDQPIPMGNGTSAGASQNQMAPQEAFDEQGRLKWSQQQLDEYFANRRAVQGAAEATPMPGTQPVQPHQPTPEEIKAKQKAAQQAEKNFRKHYSIPSGVEMPPELVGIDADFRKDMTPELAQMYDASMRANLATDATPADAMRVSMQLMGGFREHPELASVETLDSIEKAALEEGEMDDAITAAAMAHALRNPGADLKKFVKERRKQYEGDAKAKASTQAAKSYLAAYGREPGNAKEVEDDAAWRRQNAGAVPLLDAMIKADALAGTHLAGKMLRDKAALHSQATPKATVASLQSQMEKATKVTDQDFYAATLEVLNNPKGDLSQFMAARQQSRAAQGVAEAAAKAQAATDAQIVKGEKAAEKKAEKKPVEAPKAEKPVEKKPEPKKAEKKPEPKKAEKKPVEVHKPEMPSMEDWLGMSLQGRSGFERRVRAVGDAEFTKQFEAFKAEANKKIDAEKAKKDFPSVEKWLSWKDSARKIFEDRVKAAEDPELTKKFEELKTNSDKFEKAQATEAEKHNAHAAEEKAKRKEAQKDVTRDTGKDKPVEKPRNRIEAARAEGNAKNAQRAAELPQIGSSAGNVNGRELVWSAHPTVSTAEQQTKSGYASSGKRYRVWKEVDDEYAEAEKLHNEDPTWDRNGAGDHVTRRFKREMKLNELLNSHWSNVRQLFDNFETFAWEMYFANPEKTQKLLHEKAKAKHLADLEAIEKAVQEIYTPDFSFDLDWLREKTGKPKAGKAETKAKAEPKKPVAKKKAKAEESPNSPAQVYLTATKKGSEIWKVLHNAKLIDGRSSGIPFDSVSKPAFQEKVMKQSDPIVLEALRHLRELAQAVKPEFKLELPDAAQVDENKGKLVRTESEQEIIEARKANKAAKETMKGLTKDTEVATTAEQKAQALALYAYFKKFPKKAHDLYKRTVGDPTGKTEDEIAAGLVRDLSRTPRAGSRRAYITQAEKAGFKVEDFEKRVQGDADIAAEEKEALEEVNKAKKINVSDGPDSFGTEHADMSVDENGERSGGYDVSEILGVDERPNAETDTHGIVAGGKVVQKVRDAYAEAELPDPATTPVGIMLTTIKKIEQGVLSNQKKLVRYSKKGESMGPDLDAIQEVASGYLDFADETFGSNSELMEVLIKESPVLRWALAQVQFDEQFTNKEHNSRKVEAEEAAADDAAEAEAAREIDLEGDGEDSRGVYSQLPNGWLRTLGFEGDQLSALQAAIAVKVKLLQRHQSDWCSLVTWNGLRDRAKFVAKFPGGKQALRCLSYWRDQQYEGIAVDLSQLQIMWDDANVRRSIRRMVQSPADYNNLALAMRFLSRYNLEAPDCLLVMQGEQILPSRATSSKHGLTIGGGEGRFLYTEGYNCDLLSGKRSPREKRRVATFAENYVLAEVSAGGEIATHEILHAIDSSYTPISGGYYLAEAYEPRHNANHSKDEPKYISEELWAKLSSRADMGYLTTVARVLTDNPAASVREVLIAEGVPEAIATAVENLPLEERAAMAWNAYYPYTRAAAAKAAYLEWYLQRYSRLANTPGVASISEAAKAEADARGESVLEVEMFASLGELFASNRCERPLRKVFPELAGIIDSYLQQLSDNYNYDPLAHWGGDITYLRETPNNDVSKGNASGRRAEISEQNRVEAGNVGRDSGVPEQPQENAGNQETRTGKDSFTQRFIKENLKKGPAAAKLAGIDPALYETEEWKAAAQAYADAAYASRQADGSVGGYRASLKKKDTPETHQKLQEALKRQDEAKLKEALARQAFDAFEDAHRKKVEPPKGKLVEQAKNQFAYNKVADAVGRRFHAPWLREVINNAGAWAYRHGLGMMFTRDLVDTVKDKLQSIKQWAHINDLIDQEARTHQDKAVKIGQDFQSLDPKEQDAVNDLLETSVMEGQWFDIPVGKDGKPMVEKAEVTDNAEYAALSAKAKQVYRDVLRSGIETRALIRKYTKEDVERRYKERMELLGEDAAGELDSELEAALKRVDAILPDSNKPYVPLRRFGNYVVVVKSQAYADALAAYEAAYEAANAEGATARDKRDARYARQTVLEMQSNGKDYIVEYAESADDAMVRAGELEKDTGGVASYFERSVFMKSEQVSIQQLLNLVDKTERLATNSDSDLSGQSLAIKNKLHELATTIYIQSLSSNSAMKSRLRRRKVAGASHDMMRSFMTNASSESRYLGYLKHNSDLRQALSNMEKEANTSDKRAAAQVVFNEVRMRIEQDMTPQTTATNGILRLTSMMMLLTNPAFFLQNLTQPLMYSASYMAGRFGMYRPLTLTAKQMTAVAQWLKTDGTLSDLDSLVEKELITADEKQMLETMRERGLLDIGLSQEFGEFNRAALSPVMGKLAGWTDMLAGAARKVEVINRVSSALVAYRLEKARLMSKGSAQTEAEAGATKFADHVLYETHGDYSSRNAPRYFKMNGFARVITQFRKFQLIQLGLFTRMLKQSLDKAPTEERRFARMGLAYTMGTFLAVTGVKGLPLYGVMAIALGLAGGPGDDDEDVLRKTLADAGAEKPMIDLIVRGVPAMLGLDLSDKLGAGSVLSPFPYLESNKLAMKNGPDDALEVISQIMGPAASLLVRTSRGASYGWQGDYTKAAENLLPSGFANVVKAMRFGLEGLTTKAGDVVIPGEQFTFGDLIMQGVGLPTTSVTNRNLLVSSLYRHEETYKQWAKEIRYSFTQAAKDHDLRRRAEAVREWKRMNEMRRRAGFAPNKISNLTGSVKAQRKREHGAISGVETNKSNRGFVRKASELY